MVIGPYPQDARILDDKTNRIHVCSACYDHAMTSSEEGHGEGKHQETRKRRKQTLRCED